MKKFRKLIVAVMAMALALGMLTMTASAAENTVEVTVNWEGATGQDTSLWCWDADNNYTGGSWPGTQMEKVDDDTYKLTLTVGADKVNMIPNNSLGQTADLNDIDVTSGKVTINVAADLSADVVVGSDTGDSTPIAVVAVIALVAAAGVVVCVKRRAVTE